jgi:hypothetical protein
MDMIKHILRIPIFPHPLHISFMYEITEGRIQSTVVELHVIMLHIREVLHSNLSTENSYSA